MPVERGMNIGCGMVRLGGRHVLVIAVLLAGSRLASAAAATLPEEAGLEDLLRFAVANNPEIEAAFHRWQAAVERIPQAGSLPDPQVTYGYFVERVETRQTFRVEQMLPGFGKQGLREDMATEAAEAAARRLEDDVLRVRAAVQTAYADALYIQEAVTFYEQNLELLGQLEELARRMYQTAQVGQADVLRLEMEADTARVELASLRDRVRPVSARLNAALGRDTRAPVPRLRPVTESFPPVETGAAAPLIELNPRLLAGAREIARAQKAQELARREARPDFMLGVEYMDNRGPMRDEVLGMAGISIPVWQGRYRALKREAAAELRMVEREQETLRNELEAEAEMALFEVREAERSMRLFADQLLPKARQTLSVVEAAYRAGDVGVLDLVEAQRALLDFQLGHARARSEHLRRHAEWERLVGRAAETAGVRESLQQRMNPS